MTSPSRVVTAYRCLLEASGESAARFASQASEVVAALAEERDCYRSALEEIVGQDPVDLALDPQWSQRIASEALTASAPHRPSDREAPDA